MNRTLLKISHNYYTVSYQYLLIIIYYFSDYLHYYRIDNLIFLLDYNP